MGSIGKKLSNIKRKFIHSENEISFIVPQKEPMLFNAINMDINNKCNQRCRFCFSSFEDDSINMDLNTFSHMLDVIPFVKDYAGGGYGFYFSCIYEPTIHPQFLEFLEMLPIEAKNKCFFTTNLVRPMDKEFINSMISTNVGLINISIETFDADKFEYITNNKQFDSFKNNLLTLENVINENENLPEFRFITMLLRENKDEIIDLIKYCHNHFPIESHEIRTPYISIYKNMEWNKNQLLSRNEADELIGQINDLGYPVDIDIKSVDDLQILDNEKNTSLENSREPDIYDEVRKKFAMVEDLEFLFLRINPDGTCIDKITNVPEQIDLSDSSKYFKDKLIELYSYKAQVANCPSYDENNIIYSDAFILIDKLAENDVFIELTGWCCPDRKVNTDKLVIRLKGNNGDVHYYYTSTKKRFDADAFKEKEEGWCGGFSTYIEKINLKDNEYTVDFLYKTYSEETVCYSWENGIKLE